MRKLKAGTLICAMMALFVIIIVLASRHRAPARKAAESAASMASGAVRAQPAPPPSCSDAPEPVDISVAAEAKLKWLRKELGEDFIFQRSLLPGRCSKR